MNDLATSLIDFFKSHIAFTNRKMESSVDDASIESVTSRELGLLFNQSSHYDCRLEPVLDVVVSVKDLTRRLGHEIVNYAILKTEGKTSKSTDYHMKSLWLTVDYLLEKHKSQFVDMAERMVTNEPDKICESFLTVADELFIEKQYSWGCIVTLYVFAACLADYCIRNSGNEDLVGQIGETVGQYVSENMADWICNQHDV